MSDERPEKSLPEKAPAPETASPERPSMEKASPDRAPLPELRASDADRDRVVERLRDAVAEGRLDMDEFEERLEAVYASRTYAELAPLTRDLPQVPGESPTGVPATAAPAPGTPARSSWPSRIGGRGTSATAVAVMSGFQRKGYWTVPARFNAVAFWGGGEIDLRDADFAEREVVITCVAVMGGIEITVPPGVEVDVRGIGIMGGFDQGAASSPPEPGAPRVIVNGLAFWGGVGIKVKSPKGSKPLDGGKRRKEL
ncbi:DUF1707 SHOCT-like domain-containing protein [Streptomyces sp. NPDC054904]|uniref:DUF1707 SHOCT-like domain-containing protein n=2 Tax=Streptomyces TaxID=1883 RepID=UPI002481FAC2|nr:MULTISPECIES: DUF1707 domain-containing protein [unclassified Streptomyces]MDA5283962.1 DUF1707 domain-containing protein [Streptomyces sp. Isolate_45]MDX2392887.1 DUF1707 domain-containing protein [Streptomyces sp. DK15]